MLLLDIDETLSPTRPKDHPDLPEGESARAFGFTVFIPRHLLTFLRSRPDIVLLSTWGSAALDLPKAFGFNARAAVMENFTEETGIKGKFEVVKQLQPSGWADDHIKPAMAKAARELGVVVLRPRGGYITAQELALFEKKLEAAPPRVLRPEAEGKLISERGVPLGR
jgi:hypothetical protein